MRLWIYVCPNADYINERTVEALPKPLIPERASSTFLSTDNLHSQRINTMGRLAFYSRSTPISIHLEPHHVWLYGVRIVKRTTLWILDTNHWLSLLGHFTITHSVTSVKHRSFLTCVLCAELHNVIYHSITSLSTSYLCRNVTLITVRRVRPTIMHIGDIPSRNAMQLTNQYTLSLLCMNIDAHQSFCVGSGGRRGSYWHARVVQQMPPALCWN